MNNIVVIPLDLVGSIVFNVTKWKCVENRKTENRKKHKNKNEITRRLEDIYKYFEVMQMNYIMFSGYEKDCSKKHTNLHRFSFWQKYKFM